MQQIPVSDFKARCIGLLEDLQDRGDEIVVTKHGQPFARVTPLGIKRRSARGMLPGKASVRGEIVRVDWTREFEASRCRTGLVANYQRKPARRTAATPGAPAAFWYHQP